jgi:hypothetical protein
VSTHEGSPQASRPTGPVEHACIVSHIHFVSICGRGEHRCVHCVRIDATDDRYDAFSVDPKVGAARVATGVREARARVVDSAWLMCTTA